MKTWRQDRRSYHVPVSVNNCVNCCHSTHFVNGNAVTAERLKLAVNPRS
jgi:hypothetical protein